LAMGVAVRQNDLRIGQPFDIVLSSARAGGEWAWRQIYASHSAVVLGYLRGRGAADPEDLLGDVFLHVVRSIDSFRGGKDAFRAWVLTIARRRLADDLRKRSRRPQAVAPLEDLEGVGSADDTEGLAITRVEGARTIEAIRELTPEQQDVLLLRLVADLPLDEVAGVMGKRITGVKALQRRALAALGRKLSAEIFAESGIPVGVSGDS
jgi:RNA polymerase sigma-70 factor, ECF subfamily